MIDDPWVRALLAGAVLALVGAIGGMTWMQVGRPNNFQRVFWSSIWLTAISITLLTIALAMPDSP